ncbi:MAG: type IV toxin-antitoxin system AbiEi family antitoxin [Actinomycetota bacterium]|nr:type IV toxin-antitoxin system AbiEi family antitoxin [Actinomycetota bacterium]
MMKSIGTLGPVSANLILKLKEENKNIFGVSDAQRITGLSVNATTDLLSELVGRKVIARLKPGKYLILPLEAGLTGEYMENWYVVARELIRPHLYYVSHYSAMDVHNMLTQPIRVVYISTPTRRKNREIGGAEFRFIYTKPERLWGIKKEWATPQERVEVSDLERTIVDCLYAPRLCGGISEIAKGIWIAKDKVSYEKLAGYVERFGKKVVVKRLGFVLEIYQLGTAETTEQLQDFIKGSKSYALFDPSLPNEGKYLSRWRLKVNIEPEELKSIVRT